MPHLSLRVLGSLSLTLDGHPLTGFKSDKGRALLVYLALESDRAHRRERLAGLLWPDWPDRDALSRLSDTLSNLRRILGDQDAAHPFLLVSSGTIQFNRESDHWLDLQEIERIARTVQREKPDAARAIAELEAAAAAYRGPFLEGFSVRDSGPFDEWALLKREQIAQRMANALGRLAALHESRGDYEAAQRHSLRLVQLEPLDEESCRLAMRVLAAGGKRSAALGMYETCRRLLGHEFSVEPDRETSALRDAIRTGRFRPLARPSPPPQPPHKAEPTAAASPRAPAGRPAAPGSTFVCREEELAWLSDHLAGARAGHGRVVFVTGEAGSGKSALLAEFASRAMAADPELVMASGSCNALVGAGDPWLPFRDILSMFAGDVEARRAGRSITPDQAHRLRALLPDFVRALVEHGPDLLDSFVPAAALLVRIEAFRHEQVAANDVAAQLAEFTRRRGSGGTDSSPAARPAALFEQIARVLTALAAAQPLLLVLSDLQWADGESLSLLFHLGRRLDQSRVLLAGTYRGDEVELGREGVRHPLERVVNELEREYGGLRIDLPAAPGPAFVDALLDTEPNDLPESFRTALTGRTGGHPLFTLELLRGLQERSDLVLGADGRWVASPSLDWDHLPSRIEAVLAERVDRLPAGCRALLEIASVEGQEFTAEVAAGVLGATDEEVARRLSGLLRTQRLVLSVSLRRLGSRRVSRYRFTHYLLRQYLYSRLDPFDRARLHEAVARALIALHGEHAPETAVGLAWHFEQASLPDEAAGHLLIAGEQAMLLSAYQEARLHFERGLRLLTPLPSSEERTRLVSILRVRLTAVLSGTHGWGARERQAALHGAPVAEASAASLRAVLALIVQGDVLLAQGDIAGALSKAQEVRGRAEAAGDRQSLLLFHGFAGISNYTAGNLVAARCHMEEATRLHAPAEDAQLAAVLGFDPGTLVLAWLTPTLWLLGYGEQARAVAHRGMALVAAPAQHATHATLLVQRLLWHALAGFGGDYASDIAYLLRTGQEHGWPTVYTGAQFLQAWWSATAEGRDAGIEEMRACLASWEQPGNIVRLPVCSAIYAKVCAERGLLEEGLAQVDAMLAWCERGWGRVVEPELHRLRGDLLPGGAEACYLKALDLARAHATKALELRAAVSLARRWQRCGRSAEANELLAGVYGWFTEGFDTPDLLQAASLLRELSGEAERI